MTEKQPESAVRAPAPAPTSIAQPSPAPTSAQKDRGRGRIELALAIILSLTTLVTTWCGYQSRLWGNIQSAKQAAADTDERQSAEDTIVGLQMRTFDALEMNEYWKSLRQNDTETRDSIFARMRPALRKAIEASVAAGALHDPDQPGPLQRPEYILTPEQDAKRLREEAARLSAAAQNAGQVTGQYVLLTLMCASVLFFGGITGTFTSRHVRIGLGCVALVLFIVTTSFLIGLPVCKG